MDSVERRLQYMASDFAYSLLTDDNLYFIDKDKKMYIF